ncbi:putative HR-like lesion-inducer [Helianthus annuus]|nr:putative HR-like lesion-inducer [Helianthus annuus]KAJ0672962.1 putative HR-like lesion-inducer [Helianthus annuus]
MKLQIPSGSTQCHKYPLYPFENNPPTHFYWIPLFNRVPTTVNHHHHQQRPHQQRPKSQMGFFSFLGRLFFASLFILSAWQMYVFKPLYLDLHLHNPIRSIRTNASNHASVDLLLACFVT